MRWTALVAVVTLGGCKGDPEAPEPSEPDPKAGCTAVVSNSWTPTANDGWVETVVYDGNGWILDRIYDVEGPGTDYQQIWARRADGSYTEYVLDLDLDGNDDERETYAYDGDDLVGREYDWDGDGRVDESSTFVSEGGRVLEEHYDWEADGVPNSLFVFSYDGDRLQRITRDDFLNGNIDWEAKYTYDGDLIVGYDADEGADGGVEQFDRWDYDEQGRLVEWEMWDAFVTEDTVLRTYEHLDDDDLPDSGTYTSSSAGAFYQAATWVVLRDDAGRETQEHWYFDFTADGETDRTLTSGTVWDCP